MWVPGLGLGFSKYVITRACCSRARASLQPQSIRELEPEIMGYRQAAVLASVSFFLGEQAYGAARYSLTHCPIVVPDASYDLDALYYSRGAIYLPKRRLSDTLHTADGGRGSRWIGVLYDVLQLAYSHQGTSGQTCKRFSWGGC